MVGEPGQSFDLQDFAPKANMPVRINFLVGVHLETVAHERNVNRQQIRARSSQERNFVPRSHY